jgi:hypothetical protein
MGAGIGRYGRHRQRDPAGQRDPDGLVPDSYPEAARKNLLDPDIIVPPLLYLAGAASDGVTGKRFDASKWRGDLPVAEAGLLCARDAGVYQADS